MTFQLRQLPPDRPTGMPGDIETGSRAKAAASPTRDEL
jgi:hypothetical protein